MNYRHGFHAGNAADVMKHAVLWLLLRRLTAKPTPFRVLDTHAGRGLYDLAGAEALRTGEAQGGIGRLIGRPAPHPALAGWLEAVAELAGVDGRHYPGSPLLARKAMREGDRLVLAELHPDEAGALRQVFRGDPQVAVHNMDGWLALKAHLPPKERRGLVLIDPPFEAADEFDRLVEGLRVAMARWPTGQYMLWHPIKDRADVWRLHERLELSGVPKVLACELTWAEEGRVDRLAGSGLVLVNPPWRLDDELREILPALHAALAMKAGGTRVTWIVPETSASDPAA